MTDKEIQIGLIVLFFMVIPLTIAMPVFLHEWHDWLVKRKLRRAERGDK